MWNKSVGHNSDDTVFPFLKTEQKKGDVYVSAVVERVASYEFADVLDGRSVVLYFQKILDSNPRCSN
jgi:hypothetical protein